MRGVYIHIPFCKSICSYCDFCKFIYEEKWVDSYLNALEREIDKYYENDIIKSVYIGGGTPSSLSIEYLDKLFKIIKRFKTITNFEFTFECNINDINNELLLFLKNNYVNRLSIGVESFNKNNLLFLNRKHEKKEIFKKIELAKQYFNNINIDLIYALPIESMHTLKNDVSNVLKLNVDHISTYSLIIEEHTYIYNKKVKPIDEELDYKMYKYICNKLERKGYNHYEISNFARNNKMSTHNLSYWNNNEYYGFGLGSHGYINKIRYENTRNYNKYINDEYRFNEVLISTREEMENELILGLRKLKGVSVSEFEKKYNKNIFEEFNLDEAILKKYIIFEDDRIFINKDKIYIMNEILNMIM